MNKEFIIYDLETFGLNPAFDKVAQFACLRYSADFEPVAKPVVLYCKIPNDYLPSVDACLVTGITPDYVNEHGLSEAEFASKINDTLTQKQGSTYIMGYNNTRFDDNVLRYLFYRNFVPPFAPFLDRSIDCFTMMRAVHARSKDVFKYQINELGRDSLRLEDLSKANNFVHTHAHDALSDVEATAQVAKRIKEKAPEIFAEMMQSSAKAYNARILNISARTQTPIYNLTCRIKTGVDENSEDIYETKPSLELPIACLSNNYYLFNLLQDEEQYNQKKEKLLSFDLLNDKTALKEELYTISDTVKVNNFPYVKSFDRAKDEGLFTNEEVELAFKRAAELSAEILKKSHALPIDLATLANGKRAGFTPFEYKDSDESLFDYISYSRDEIFKEIELAVNTGDVKLMCDKLQECSDVYNAGVKRREKSADLLLPKIRMLLRYICRNFDLASLPASVQKSWQGHCKARLTTPPCDKIRNKADFEKEIAASKLRFAGDSQKLKLIKEIEDYGQKVLAKLP